MSREIASCHGKSQPALQTWSNLHLPPKAPVPVPHQLHYLSNHQARRTQVRGLGHGNGLVSRSEKEQTAVEIPSSWPTDHNLPWSSCTPCWKRSRSIGPSSTYCIRCLAKLHCPIAKGYPTSGPISSLKPIQGSTPESPERGDDHRWGPQVRERPGFCL